MPNNIKKIAIVGPESTGKTTLSKMLSGYYNEPYVSEAARDYLAKNKKYNLDDVYKIGLMQLEYEKNVIKKARKYLFCDTNLLVNLVWSKYVFNHIEEKLLNIFNPYEYNHYILCNIDVPWEPDELREHPLQRKEIFDIYYHMLIEYRLTFTIVAGSETERLSKCIKIIDNLK